MDPYTLAETYTNTLYFPLLCWGYDASVQMVNQPSCWDNKVFKLFQTVWSCKSTIPNLFYATERFTVRRYFQGVHGPGVGDRCCRKQGQSGQFVSGFSPLKLKCWMSPLLFDWHFSHDRHSWDHCTGCCGPVSLLTLTLMVPEDEETTRKHQNRTGLQQSRRPKEEG